MDRRFRWLAVAMTCALAGAAHAQALTGTLKKIKDTGVVSLGIRESSVPFSYSDNQQKNVGPYGKPCGARLRWYLQKFVKNYPAATSLISVHS